MKLKIKVTKEVLEATKMCGEGNWKLPESNNKETTSNCAITYACRKLFPNCETSHLHIHIPYNDGYNILIELPIEATNFILLFDRSTPEERVKLKPFEFEVNVPDEVIDAIGITQVEEILKQSTTLEYAGGYNCRHVIIFVDESN